MTDFEVVPDTERRPKANSGRQPSALSVALVEGKTVFVPHYGDTRFLGRSSYLRNRGYRVVSRKGERDGIPGVYLWAERRDA